MQENVQAAVAALKNAPGFEGVTADNCSVTRLGGLTNLVHLVDTGADRVIVRIPGDGTEEYIDRKVELTNAKAAWKAAP